MKNKDAACGSTQRRRATFSYPSVLSRKPRWGALGEMLESRAYFAVTLPSSPPIYQTAGTVLSRPVVEDFNHDGRPDLAVANNSVNSTAGVVSVFINAGDGTFAPKVDLTAGPRTYQVVAGDFNSDGNIDLVATNSQDGTLSSFLGDGTGAFGPQILSTYGSSTTQGAAGAVRIVATDLNNDLSPDLVIADSADSTLVTMLSNLSGGFTVKQTIATPQTGVSYGPVVTSDFNGDGMADIATIVGTRSQVSIFFGVGDGTLGTPLNLQVPDVNGQIAVGADLAVEDFNNDAHPDIAIPVGTSNGSQDTLSVFISNNNGLFQTGVNTALPASDEFVSAGDIDGDGSADVITTSGASIHVLLGNGNGSFQTTPAFSLDNFPVDTSPAVADLNADSKLDLVVGHSAGSLSSGHSLAVFLNGESGGGTPTPTPTPTSPASLAPTLPGAVPVSFIAGQKQKASTVIVDVTNSGGATSAGRSTVQLFLSTDTTLDDADQLVATQTRALRIKGGRLAALKFKLTSVPAAVAAAGYHVIAKVTDSAGTVTTVAATATTSVVVPFVDLVATAVTTPTAMTPGKKIATTLTITNSGNVLASGPVSVAFLARPSGTAGEADIALATVASKVKIASTKTARLKLKFLVPTSLAAGTYSLVATVTPAGVLTDSDLNSNIAVSATMFTVV